MMMAKLLYDDGVFRVSSAVIATPHRFYPIANTTAGVRRDAMWVGIALLGVSAASLHVYGDLLFPLEKALLLSTSAAITVIGSQFVFLRIGATGHRPATLFGSRRRICALYDAIWRARLADSTLTIIDDDPQTPAQ